MCLAPDPRRCACLRPCSPTAALRSLLRRLLPLSSPPSYEVESFEELRGADARRVILFLAVMAAHAVGEGSGVGVSFSGERGWAAGTTVTLAIGLHNVPGEQGVCEGSARSRAGSAGGATAVRMGHQCGCASK